MKQEIILITVCVDGFYNGSCMGTCGNCQKGEPCDKQTGKCNNSCQPHFKYPFCKGTILRGQKYSFNEYIIYFGIISVRGYCGLLLTTNLRPHERMTK